MEDKDAKHIHILEMDDKRQVMVVVSTIANIKLLHFHVITSEITLWLLLPTSVG